MFALPSYPAQLRKGTNKGSLEAILALTIAWYDPFPKLMDSTLKEKFLSLYFWKPTCWAGSRESGANTISIVISGHMLVSRNLYNSNSNRQYKVQTSPRFRKMYTYTVKHRNGTTSALLFDDEDAHAVRSAGLFVSDTGYVYVSKPRKMPVARWLLNIQNADEESDHIDRNKLNNQRSNLRIVNRQQNSWNRINKRSKFVGVSLEKGKWRARCQGPNNKKVNLGSFHCPIEAACARDDYAFAQRGCHAHLNFPDRKL